MKLIFKSKTTISQVEQFLQTLRPEEGTGRYHMFRTFPKALDTHGLILAHWGEDEDDVSCNYYGYAHKIKNGGWAIYAGSGLQRIQFLTQGKGTVVAYEGPFNGLGESPYTPPLELKEVLRGRVSATGYQGDVKGYLAHRAKTLVRLETISGGELHLERAALPTLFSDQGWSLWIHQVQSPVEGFEHVSPKWAGSKVKVEFLNFRPKSERVWDSRQFWSDQENVPAWVKKAIRSD